MKSLLNIKWNKLFYNILFIIVWNLFLNLINAKKITVNNESELINSFSYANNNSINELIININDTTFELLDDIIINNSIEKLYIIGKSKEQSILKFNNIKNGMIFTNSLYEINQEIKFVNLTITGHLELYSIVNVIFEDVEINGNVLFDKSNKYLWSSGDYNYNIEYFEKNLNVTITMTRITYTSLSDTPTYCLNLFGNVILKDSKFYGHSLCTYAIIDYNGEDTNNLSISNSYFNGMYENECIKIYNAKNTNINSSIFENGTSNVYGGGAMLLYNSAFDIKNCTFRNFYTPYYGGIFYIYYPKSFLVDGINVYNTTAMYGGSLLYVYSLWDNERDINLLNVNLYGAGLLDQPVPYGGLIATIDGYINLNMLNFYGEDLYEGNGYGLFLMQYKTNIELKRVFGPNMGSIIAYSIENSNNSNFHITNGAFIDFYQDLSNPASIAIASAVIMALEEINILFKNTITIENSHFENNSGINGAIFFIDHVSEDFDNDIIINNSLFESNHAENFGGVIYTPNKFNVTKSNSRISFNNCEFRNNTAKKGDISFSFTKSDSPYFTNIEELIKMGSIVSNPTHIKLLSESYDSIEMLSGETLLNEINFVIMDDYDNIINTDPIEKVDDIFFFKVEFNDTYNAKLVCQSGYYCDIGTCSIPSLKGHPGNYDLIIKLQTFGNYKMFNDSVITIDLKIKECNNSFLYQDIENVGIKSWYSHLSCF
ncbi:hypothetical protein PIROE2DRAFT_10730 [Piromyces sp. E2]|nr:hypothetical protein PIROE2DRAFT_10730 [Piromyces sp. E2]|eukprot:OUM62869.1 hypothetical protein PIROE2DRAFT_10730 [Piromyces sp. E2]